MMWQFLFNPSELELELGPEFKNAETWGVSDKGNSGQPLHWSHNKNAVLKFNSVLLNGFIFGRKVEALEQGLIELFMARDDAGQHGPHILEFVWGKRVFGPCVIKNVNIKEKMWDEGEVVNAEVSFTLEQIPEWTINDGFVDVARPGRLIVQGDPTITSNPASKVAGVATESNKNPNPGVGKKSDPKSKDQNRSPITALYSKCQRAGVFADKFAKIEKNSAPNYAATTGSVVRQRSLYNQLYPQAVNELGLDFTKRISNPMANPTNLYKSTELAIEQENNKGPFDLTRNYARAMGYVQGVANSGRIAASSFSKSAQCVEERKKVDAETKAQKQVKQCQGKRLGSECSNSGAYVTTCSGIRLICSRGFLRDPSRASIGG
jgi:hypothetical protein